MKDIRNLFRTDKGTKAIKDMKIKKEKKNGNMETWKIQLTIANGSISSIDNDNDCV